MLRLWLDGQGYRAIAGLVRPDRKTVRKMIEHRELPERHKHRLDRARQDTHGGELNVSRQRSVASPG